MTDPELDAAVAATSADPAVAPRLAALVAAVDALDRDAVVATVRAVPVQDRPVLGPGFEAWFRERSRQSGGRDTGVLPVYALAVVGIAARPADAARLVGAGDRWTSVDPAVPAARVADIVRDRGRSWLTRFVASALGNRDRMSAIVWHLARQLTDAGLIDTPAHVHYRSDALWAYDWPDLPHLVATDPGLRDAIEGLLTTPGVGHTLGLTYPSHRPDGGGRRAKNEPPRSRYPDDAWAGLLGAWGTDDPSRRPGLVDACLAALSGGVLERDAAGFVAVHVRLGLTLDEVVARQSTYASLLLAPGTSTVALARTELRRLLEAGLLDGDALLDVTPDVLARREKVIVREHVRLLTDALAAGAVDPGGCARAVVGGLDPERTDVALVLARLLRRCLRAAPTIADEISRGVSSAVPDPTPELRAALGPLAPVPDEAQHVDEHPPVRPAPAAAPLPVDLPAPGRLDPVRDLSELRELLEEMHVVPATALDVERALDGLVRLRTDPTAARALVDDLGRRPRGVPPLDDALRSWAGWETPATTSTVLRTGRVLDPAEAPPGAELVEFARTTVGIPHPDTGVPRTPSTVTIWEWRLRVPAWTPGLLVRSRLLEVAHVHLRRPAGALLATPTHDDGTLTADAFLARLHERTSAGLGVAPHDLGTALLRVRPTDRAALRDSGALGAGADERLALLDTPLAWHRANVFPPDRNTVGDTPGPAISVWQAPGSPTGAPDDPVHAWLDSQQLAPMWWDLTCWLSRHRENDLLELGMWATTLPSHPDAFAAHLQRVLAETTDRHDADASAVMELLGAYRCPLGEPAVHALVVGGASRSELGRAAAAEALARTASAGLVTAPVLAGAVRAALDPDAAPHSTGGSAGEVRPKANRVVVTLADAAGIDDTTGRVVLDALVIDLERLAELRGGVAFVELAARLAERFRVRVDLPPALATLAAGRSRSRTAQEARRLAAAGDR